MKIILSHSTFYVNWVGNCGKTEYRKCGTHDISGVLHHYWKRCSSSSWERWEVLSTLFRSSGGVIPKFNVGKIHFARPLMHDARGWILLRVLSGIRCEHIFFFVGSKTHTIARAFFLSQKNIFSGFSIQRKHKYGWLIWMIL